VIVHGRRARAVSAVAEANSADSGQAEGLTADLTDGDLDSLVNDSRCPQAWVPGSWSGYLGTDGRGGPGVLSVRSGRSGLGHGVRLPAQCRGNRGYSGAG
jgi:hypothetical protein